MQTVDHPTSHRRPGLPRTGGPTPRRPRTPVAPAPVRRPLPCRVEDPELWFAESPGPARGGQGPVRRLPPPGRLPGRRPGPRRALGGLGRRDLRARRGDRAEATAGTSPQGRRPREARSATDRTFIQNEGTAMNMLEHELAGCRMRELQAEAQAASRARGSTARGGAVRARRARSAPMPAPLRRAQRRRRPLRPGPSGRPPVASGHEARSSGRSLAEVRPDPVLRRRTSRTPRSRGAIPRGRPGSRRRRRAGTARRSTRSSPGGSAGRPAAGSAAGRAGWRRSAGSAIRAACSCIQARVKWKCRSTSGLEQRAQVVEHPLGVHLHVRPDEALGAQVGEDLVGLAGQRPAQQPADRLGMAVGQPGRGPEVDDAEPPVGEQPEVARVRDRRAAGRPAADRRSAARPAGARRGRAAPGCRRR